MTDALAKKVQSLKDRLDRMDKEVRGLKDVLNIHDNWNSEVRQWIGQEVRVKDVGDHDFYGTLKWSDRYNICLSSPHNGLRVYNKGGIVWIEPTANK